jgi:hypothetical protein
MEGGTTLGKMTLQNVCCELLKSDRKEVAAICGDLRVRDPTKYRMGLAKAY